MTHRTGRIDKALFLACLFQFWPRAAHAQTGVGGQAEGLLQRAPESDWALGWLEVLFRGAALPQGLADGAVHLPVLAKALREALSLYSLGLLVLAGFLVAYHVVVMIAETAHYGTIMGRRTNQFWAPLRFVLAIGLLVPIGGGLNAGQYIVVKLAESGSSLASHAWSAAAETMKGSLGQVVAPRGPDVARLTAVAAEMEICRSLYRHIYASMMPDVVLTHIGDMTEIQKIPLGRLAPESWRYTNTLHAEAPLCGEYRFLSRNQEPTNAGADDETGGFPNELADFARADAERLMMQTRVLAERVAPAFLSGSATTVAASNDIGGSLSTMMQDQQKTIDAKLRAMTSGAGSPIARVMQESTLTGWATAGFFVGAIARRQAIFGELATYAAPAVQAPVFGHKALTTAMLMEAVASDPFLRHLTEAQLDKVFAVYAQTAASMKQARAWLYARQIVQGDMILADTLDVRDHIGPTSDFTAGRFMFTRLLNSAMATYGVGADSGRSGAAHGAQVSFVHDMAANPFAGVAEMGRRYSALSSYLFGMAGPGLSEPSVMGSALVFVVIGLVFGAAGFMLLFAVPLLPLFRFLVGILTWLLIVLEAVVALPLVALAHLYPAGEGLSGPIARQAYWLWLAVFMRPMLTLFGFMGGLILLTFALTLLNNFYAPLTQALYANPGDVFVTVRVGLALFYAVLVVAMTNMAFKGIDWLPDRALRWLGQADVLPGAAGGSAGTTGSHVAPFSPSSGIDASPSVKIQKAASAAAGADPSASERTTPAMAAATAKAHGLKSALLPAYREPPVEPVVIGPKEEKVSGVTVSGAQSGSVAAATASGDKASASATAHATAMAMARQIPLPDKPTPADIEKALEKLARTIDKKTPSSTKDVSVPSDNEATKTESREQSSAPPEDDEPT